jgi:hypothetical protein
MTDKDLDKPAQQEAATPDDENPVLTRRAVLSRAGKLAWTAPVLVALQIPGTPAQAQGPSTSCDSRFCPPSPGGVGNSSHF